MLTGDESVDAVVELFEAAEAVMMAADAPAKQNAIARAKGAAEAMLRHAVPEKREPLAGAMGAFLGSVEAAAKGDEASKRRILGALVQMRRALTVDWLH